MNTNLQMRLDVILPNAGKRLTAAIKVDEYTFHESFAPLPADRELPFAVLSRQKAARQKQMRADIARHLGMQLAVKMLELIEAEDPQSGYSPDEWRRINSE